MAKYLVYVSQGKDYHYIGSVDAKKPKKAVQKWLDQTHEPAETRAVSKLKDADYIAVKASDTYGYRKVRK